jgi:hypothetical protein
MSDEKPHSRKDAARRVLRGALEGRLAEIEREIAEARREGDDDRTERLIREAQALRDLWWQPQPGDEHGAIADLPIPKG